MGIPVTKAELNAEAELVKAIKEIDYLWIAGFTIRVNEDSMYSDLFRKQVNKLYDQIYNLNTKLRALRNKGV